jgi:beta-N-acetylhexosaminidase
MAYDDEDDDFTWAEKARGRHAAERRGGRTPVYVAVAVVVALVATFAVIRLVSGSGTPDPAAQSTEQGSGRGAATAGPSAGAAASCVQTTLARLGLEGQVGQVLMIGTAVGKPGEVEATVKQYRLGGVFLRGRSSAPAAQLRSALADLQDAAKQAGGVALQIGADQEGGQVQTLQGNDFPRIPSAVQQGKLDKGRLTSQTTQWAGRLKDVGVTIDLAPVADIVPVDLGADNPPIGAFDRQYGDTPEQVSADVATVVAAAEAAGVQTTLKHFPGLGRVRANTDTSHNAKDTTATVDDPAFRPFADGITAGATAVMISSALYPKLDPDAIAAFSQPIVTGLLRQKLGFKGLVMSDDLGAAVAADTVPTGERAVRFIRAGGDLVLSVRTADAKTMTNALLAEAKGSPEFANRVKESAARVLQSKAKAGLLTCTG